MSHKWRDLEKVVGSDPGSEQGLMSIPEGGVCDHGSFVLSNSLGEGLGAILLKEIAQSEGRTMHWGSGGVHTEQKHGTLGEGGPWTK